VCSLLVFALVVVLPARPAAAGHAFPATIALPNGWQPEGIAIGRGATIYAGSLATGAIYRANLRTGQGSVLVPPQEGRVAVGMKFDLRTNLLYVAGGATGDIYVYDARTGASVASLEATSEATTFVNDAVVTRRAVYFTDSFRPVLYRVPLAFGGALPAAPSVEEIPLGGDFEFVAGEFNANGIEAAFGGRRLLVVNSVLGTLYLVNPSNGDATRVDLGDASLESGDGILLARDRLYVVQNFLNQITVVDLDRGFTSGTVERVITDPRFDIPTTIDAFGPALYAVNARFSTTPTPDTEYTIVRVSR
jgi:outer membrane protein assembly factor BamB